MKVESISVGAEPRTPHAKRKWLDGMMSGGELALLEKLADETPVKHFLEIGVFKGTTTTMLAGLGTVVAVDWFLDYDTNLSGAKVLEEFLYSIREEMKVADKITILTGEKSEVLPILKNDRFGLVLIDANHSVDSCYRDICNVWELIVSSGWLAMDDWTSEGGVRGAWEKFAKERGLLELTLFSVDVNSPKLVAVQKP